MAKILWYTGPKFSANVRRMNDAYVASEDIRPSDIFYVPLRAKIPDSTITKGKNKITYNTQRRNEFKRQWDMYIEKIDPKIIVINDEITLSFFLDQHTNTLALHRGSIYHYKDVPVIVLDSVLKTKADVKFPWIYKQDLKKLKRWLHDQQRPQPRFNYTVCNTRDDLDKFAAYARDSFLIADDIETAGGHITCIGMCCVHDNGVLHSFVIPFINPLKEGGCHWENEDDEIRAWQIVRDIHNSKAYKVFQNGTYDSAYYIKYNTAPRRYLLDTFHMFNSIWTEAPKKLWFISSIFLDYCKYWKDESKGEAKDKDKNERMPSTPLGLEMYWRYNAQDVYNTVMNAIYLLQIICNPRQSWVMTNYVNEIEQNLGPALAMTMRGMKHNTRRQANKMMKWAADYEESLETLQVMCDDPEFNPNSPTEVASLIYDVLGAPPVRLKGKNAKKLPERTTDEKILRIIATRHPIFSMFIEKIWDTKKPKNLTSKYGKSLGINGRFHYSLQCVLETDRYRSSNHPYWIGTNAQNVPKDVRDMFVADKGYVLWEVDYSQSDLYFVAFQCEDPELINVVLSDDDTHCLHAAYFFKSEYERVLEAHKADSDWTDHPTKGIRQNTKRITHGASYQMADFTLFITMGREAAIGVCKSLGYKDAGQWEDTQIVKILGTLLNAYFVKYKGLKAWQRSSVEECAKNGNLADNGFGRTRLFFGDIRNDPTIQRQLSSYFGQGGTAGNINRTLNEVYWRSGLEKEGLMLLMQDHDSIIFQTPKDKLYLGEKLLTIMGEPVTIKGRTFAVPVDSKVGLSWGKAMIPYRKGITYAEIKAHDEAWDARNYSL